MQKLITAFVFLCLLFPLSLKAEKKSEALFRLKYLSEKNATIITNALDSMIGVTNIEAYYEIKALIIEHDESVSEDDILKMISSLNLNTPVERINPKDIPIIRNKYKATLLRHVD